MKILGISGSIREKSYNTALLREAARLTPEGVQLLIGPGLDSLPHFNPDLETAGAPESVLLFREAITQADALYIVSPEYAHSLPGVLKNALDWVTGSGEMIDKPVGVLNASPNHLGAAKVQASLLYLLNVLSAHVVEDAVLSVPGVREKVDEQGVLIHDDTAQQIRECLNALLVTSTV